MAEVVQDRYLTDKKVILNSPGEKKFDIYYSKDESSVSMIEATYTDGRFNQNLTNKNFGGAGSINIPNQSLVSTAYLQVELPVTVADQTLTRGWLFSAIDRIDYVFGSASVGNLSINGNSIFQICMAQCETTEKRNQMIKLAGEEVLISGVYPTGQIVLPLPFSSSCAMFSKKPYDTALLNSPIQVNVYFKPGSSIYGGSAVVPTEMNAARVLLRQGQLAFPDQGLKSILRMRPDMSYSYPIIHKQSFITQATSGSTPYGRGQGYELNFLLQQFIYADLLGIMIGIVKQDDVQPPTVGDTPNPLNYAVVNNFRCLFNGNVVYDSPNNIRLLYQLTNETSATYVQNSIVAAGTTAPFASSPVNTNFIIMDFSRERQVCFEDGPNGFDNVWRIAQQTLTCTCGVPEASKTYLIYCTYLYNGIIETKSQGTSLIYYD